MLNDIAKVPWANITDQDENITRLQSRTLGRGAWFDPLDL
jgi:hypothetical protein